MELTGRQKAIIVGAILGDSNLEKRWKNPRLRFAHSVSQKEYVLWKYRELRNIASSAPIPIRQLHWQNGKMCESWQFATRALTELTHYWNLFCSSGTKRIPPNISDILTHPLSLAIWLMDDGYKRNDCNAFRLNTDAFPIAEQQLLQTALTENFGIHSKLHRKGKYWNIYIPEASARRFVALVREHVIPCMEYKIALTPVTTGVSGETETKIFPSSRKYNTLTSYSSERMMV